MAKNGQKQQKQAFSWFKLGTDFYYQGLQSGLLLFPPKKLSEDLSHIKFEAKMLTGCGDMPKKPTVHHFSTKNRIAKRYWDWAPPESEDLGSDIDTLPSYDIVKTPPKPRPAYKGKEQRELDALIAEGLATCHITSTYRPIHHEVSRYTNSTEDAPRNAPPMNDQCKHYADGSGCARDGGQKKLYPGEDEVGGFDGSWCLARMQRMEPAVHWKSWPMEEIPGGA
ncbi:hypothetical protein B0H14DRAFT_3124299 [Mycena olivaceomarginata]|nr:hypothetical protein B0H14DRAFT_3124299 [Mycena olivaceomarginata]